jgi:multidrug efflux pump subunit AcrB
MQDVFSGFAGAMGTAVQFIYAVLLLLFANFLHPVTIMGALALSLGGALLFGKRMYEATLDSGVARLLPILMTTIAMIAGMVPIALGIGAVGKLAARCDGGNWRFDDFYAADSGGDSAGFYLHGRFANLDF